MNFHFEVGKSVSLFDIMSNDIKYKFTEKEYEEYALRITVAFICTPFKTIPVRLEDCNSGSLARVNHDNG